MGTKVRVFRATANFASLMAEVVRPADRAEVKASGGYEDMLDLLLKCLMFSGPQSWAVTFNGEPAAMYGVGESDDSRDTFLSAPEFGIPWLLTGVCVDHYPIAFMRLCRKELPKMLERYPLLGQMIDARHEAALRWAGRLGFEIGLPVPWGAEGRLFHPVEIRREARV